MKKVYFKNVSMFLNIINLVNFETDKKFFTIFLEKISMKKKMLFSTKKKRFL